MTTQPAGSLWLKQHFALEHHRVSHRSYIGTRNKIQAGRDGGVDQTYGPKYAPGDDDVTGHIEFMLKYDDLSLDLLTAVFNRISERELLGYISGNPGGRYARKTGFLYEWLTGRTLSLEHTPEGNYTDLLDEQRYITGIKYRNSRWRVNDNLLGTPAFCPVVRRTPALTEMLARDIKKIITNLKEAYTPGTFNRAAQYLYRKETRSSYEIESETPSPDRMQRFITLLRQAGRQPGGVVLEEKNLTALQNTIVDPRYMQPGFRQFQNYIGQTDHRMEEIYHYICPPPGMVRSMMEGLTALEKKTAGIPAAIRAALIAFGFVFIHPFLDGNGRIHRFLIHDMLTRDGLAEQDVVIPISARMLNNMRDYDAALEDFSLPLMQRIRFIRSADGEITVTNPEETAPYFRYPDLTVQSAYLAHTIYAAVRQDLSDELSFLQHYDELKKDLSNLVDMPDKGLDSIIVYLHQNKGVFPNRRKKNFPEITEQEFTAMENLYREIFRDV